MVDEFWARRFRFYRLALAAVEAGNFACSCKALRSFRFVFVYSPVVILLPSVLLLLCMFFCFFLVEVIIYTTDMTGLEMN